MTLRFDDRQSIDVIPLNENRLSYIDRLGLAYCRLNNYEWDPLLGPKPWDFDTLPAYIPPKKFLFWRSRKQTRCKHFITWPAAQAILSIIGEANASRCHWMFELMRTEDEWLEWYIKTGHEQMRKNGIR